MRWTESSTRESIVPWTVTSHTAVRTAWSIPANRQSVLSSWYALGMANSAANTKTNTQ